PSCPARSKCNSNAPRFSRVVILCTRSAAHPQQIGEERPQHKHRGSAWLRYGVNRVDAGLGETACSTKGLDIRERTALCLKVEEEKGGWVVIENRQIRNLARCDYGVRGTTEYG